MKPMACDFTLALSNLIKETKDHLNDLAEETPFLYLKEEEKDFFLKETSPLLRKGKKSKKEAPSFKEPFVSKAPLKMEKTKPLPFNFQKEKKVEVPSKIILPTITLPATKQKKIAPQASKESPVLSSFIKLEKPSKNEQNFEETKKMIETAQPNFPFNFNVPSDHRAKLLAQKWKLKKQATAITIFSFKETPQALLFLKNLSCALDVLFLPTKIVKAIEIEKENQWNVFLSQVDLKLILACDYSIWGMPNLIKYCKEMPATKEYFLKDIPLFLLPDISIYLKEPLLKKSLLASLQQKITKLKKS